jgi:hypothetical protein
MAHPAYHAIQQGCHSERSEESASMVVGRDYVGAAVSGVTRPFASLWMTAFGGDKERAVKLIDALYASIKRVGYRMRRSNIGLKAKASISLFKR